MFLTPVLVGSALPRGQLISLLPQSGRRVYFLTCCLLSSIESAGSQFLISLHASYRSKGGVLYIYLSPIAGGPTPIYIPLSEAQGRWPPYMVGRRMLQITSYAMALNILPKLTRHGKWRLTNQIFLLIQGLLRVPKCDIIILQNTANNHAIGSNNVASHLIGRSVVPPAHCRSVCPSYIFIIAKFLL